MATISFRGSREDLSRIISLAADIASGDTRDRQNIGKGINSAIGLAALSDIKRSYVDKARGGTDEMGIKWPPLSPVTIANRRVGRGASPEIKARERIRKREAKKALARFRLSLPEPEAQRRSKIVGGLKAFHETGKTKVQALGGRSVEILRDTGVLLNSLSPGDLGPDQVFETDKVGEVTVGTNIVYAGTHQRGNPSKNIPARPFLPDDNYPVPDAWWNNWVRAANRALLSGLIRLVKQG